MARRVPVVEEIGGHRVADPYRWLEEGSPDGGTDGADDGAAARAEWLARQQALFEEWSRECAGPRAAFGDALRRLADAGGTAAPALTPPVWRGARRFRMRRQPGQELPVLVCQDTDTGEAERVLVDPLELDATARTAVAAWRPSRTGALLAYQTSAQGSEEPLLRVIGVADGKPRGPALRPGRFTPVVWLPDDSGFFYVTCPPGGAAREVRLHRLDGGPGGTADDTAEGSVRDGPRDALVFAADARQMSLWSSPDGRWLAVSTAPGAQTGNRILLADLAAGPVESPAWQEVYDGTATGAQAVLRFGPAGTVYALTTSRAAGGRVCRVDPRQPGSAHWTPLLTPPPGEVLTGCVPLTDPATGAVRLLAATQRDGAAVLRLHDGDGAPLAGIPVPGQGPGTLSRLTAPQDGSSQAWFLYTDFVTPPTVHRFDLATGRCVAEGAAAPAVAAVVHRSAVPADDGTEVPVYLIAPAGHDPARGPRPALLHAYGGFGATAAPAYSPAIMAWVEAGGLYAIAAVRGGGERGTAWHAAGRGRNKPTAFADFAAVARWLIAAGHTAPGQLAVKGGSHAGLMAAVALTRDPGLYAAAVCSGAPTDMVRYPHLGMGRWWLAEFGDPADPKDLEVLLSYSPYHRVRPGTRYPAVLLTTGRTDERVGSAHTFKLTAALQHATASGRPVLLRCEDGVGHGMRAASRHIDAEADALAFCAVHTGLLAG